MKWRFVGGLLVVVGLVLVILYLTPGWSKADLALPGIVLIGIGAATLAQTSRRSRRA